MGALSPDGAPAQLIRRWLAGEFELLVSSELIGELTRVLSYPKIASRISSGDAAILLELLDAEAHAVSDPARTVPMEVEDPGDVYLVALAIDQGAALVTGDRHLSVLAGRLPVFRPADFLSRLIQR